MGLCCTSLVLWVNCKCNLCHSRQTQKKRFTSASLFFKLAFVVGLHCASLALAGKLRLQFMPSLANTKKPQFPAVIFQAGVPTGIVLAAWFCFAKSAPSRHSLRSALFANAKSHRLRLSLRTTFGVEPKGSHPVGIQKSPQTLLFAGFLNGGDGGSRTLVLKTFGYTVYNA